MSIRPIQSSLRPRAPSIALVTPLTPAWRDQAMASAPPGAVEPASWAVMLGLALALILMLALLIRSRRIKTSLHLTAVNAPVMIRAHDATGAPLFWNKECERVTGYAASRIVGNADSWTLLHPDPVLRTETRELRSDPPRDYSGRVSVMTCADGSTRVISWTSVSASCPVPKWSNWETGVDITARHASAEAIKERDLRQKAILDNIPDVAWFKDNTLRIVAVNRMFCELTGKSEAELLGRTSLDLWPIEYGGPAMEADRLVLREGRSGWNEERVPVPGGEDAWHETHRAPVFDAGGGVIGIVGIGRDVTEKRRTARELLLAKVRAEKASRAKNEFLASMSHEIRTPLNGILGMLQLMLSTPMNDEQHGYVTAAASSSKRLSRLLSDVLDTAKIEAGQLEIVREPFALEELRSSVQDTFQLLAEQRGIDLRISLDPDSPRRAVGDVARLRQILFNLVGNAFKFTDKGSVHVDISCPHRRTDQCRLLLSVSDTGAGIPADMLDKVFESFTQADASASRRHGGVGLGLAIVRRLAQLMDANATISSAPGEGTEISLSVPVAVAQVQERTQALRDTADVRPLRFLVAEDDQINRMAITRLLEKNGHHAQCVQNGVELLDVITSRPFDLVLMDVQMPVMDGLEATRHIRLLPEFDSVRDIPIIALTACAMAGDRERILASGMNDYATKPLDWKTLAGMINGLWGNVETGRPVSGEGSKPD